MFIFTIICVYVSIPIYIYTSACPWPVVFVHGGDKKVLPVHFNAPLKHRGGFGGAGVHLRAPHAVLAGTRQLRPRVLKK